MTYRVVEAATMKPVGRVYKTLAAAQSYAHHVSMCRGKLYLVARMVPVA